MYVFAHPDDETFACGGTIVHHHLAGDRQVLFCATKGEAGKTGNPPVCRPEELGTVRAEELKRAIAILGIDELIHRDYGDGKLDQVPKEQLVADIHSILEREKPEKVFTFPPSGISGHRDHKVIQQATLEAVKRCSFATKLYYAVIPESVARLHGRQVHTVPDHEVTDSLDVTPYLDKIIAALKEHKSQSLSVKKAYPGILENDRSRFRTREYYQLAWENKGSHQ
jgi:LmbE family N-acetylglucosaminyl deacetylase